MFPHHENEIAQSKCFSPGSQFAKYWIHNGFLTVDGEKMSKSLGNFKTVRELIDDGVDGSVIRYFYLTTHYKKPLDLTDKALKDSEKAMRKISNAYSQLADINVEVDNEIMDALSDDMNTPAVLSRLHILASKIQQGDVKVYGPRLIWGMDLLGLKPITDVSDISDDIKEFAANRLIAKKNKNWELADTLRKEIELRGYKILDTHDSYKLERK
jgi:cysteinyl-tRNA synthetase